MSDAKLPQWWIPPQPNETHEEMLNRSYDVYVGFCRWNDESPNLTRKQYVESLRIGLDPYYKRPEGGPADE